MKRVLLLLSTATYRAQAFLDAARRLGTGVTVGSDRGQVLAALHPEGHLTLPFGDPAVAAERIATLHATHPVAAVIAADDDGAELAAIASAALGLPHHPPAAVRTARNKAASRMRLRAAGLRQPRFVTSSAANGPPSSGAVPAFPVVVKPQDLSASQGVIRADDGSALQAAHARTAALLRRLHPSAPPETLGMLVEEYLPGAEIAVEGIVTQGRLRVLAIFDKPDPLEGPFFEETLYVTPSRRSEEEQRTLIAETARAVAALGLTQGAVHAELRLTPRGPVVLEIAPRSIGGLCSRSLRFGAGETLEMLLLRHALGEDVEGLDRETQAAGVMMLPIPAAGTLRAIEGVESARSVPGIEDVRFTMGPGSELVPLPEGGSYLGFLFARGGSPAEVERALREAHRALKFDIEPRGLEPLESRLR